MIILYLDGLVPGGGEGDREDVLGVVLELALRIASGEVLSHKPDRTKCPVLCKI
jgi:hypothetical protein